MSVTALFLVPALIWGSTWYAITWQLGVVAPEALMAYIVEKVSALPGWSLEPQRVNATAGRVEGTYKDADGTTWRSSTLIEPSKDAGTQIVTMTIEKRGAPSGH